MRMTEVGAHALVATEEGAGLRYVWEYDVEGDVAKGEFRFPVVMERGDRVSVEVDGQTTTLTVQQVIYQPSDCSVRLKLG